jgi:hypothetical protein
MNRRTLKKHCWRAVAVMIAEYGYSLHDFMSSDGSESVDAPIGMERRFVENGFLRPGPLAGTPLWFELTYLGGMNVKLPSEMLKEIELWRDVGEMLKNDKSADGVCMSGMWVRRA